jgi:hypothetical protein
MQSRDQMRDRRCLRASARAAGGLAGALLLLLAVASPRADIPRMTAAIGYGPAGLFHEEYVDGAMRASGMGEFSSGATWLDLTFLFPSHLTLGLRTHSMRTELGDGTAAGRLDLVPTTLVIGYRRPALAGRLGGFVSLAGGVATAHFRPAATIGNWLPWDQDAIDVTHKRPGVFEASAGTAYRLSNALSLELALTSAFVDTEVSFKPAPVDSTGFTPGRAYRVKGRHLAASLALRWWVEFL